MEAWVFWLVLGVILMVAEILTPTFFIFWFGVGALAASLVSLYLGVYVQIIVFAAVSIVLVFFTRRLVQNWESPRKIHVEEIAGKVALVIETIDNRKGTGLVKIDGDVWRAYAEDDDEVIEKGEHVKIMKVEGAHVVVKRV
ncbi:protein of unknown function DUF107 [Thermotoga petrophila RKU-1]|uniref:NfeD-like C-terminal domain-containing protein n=1 Tax=Thermotoga petrophila (strain ATCC BAA-488 / DSM 13995 / JCM 10881 / RKU-1) TaxID=390874 RepID=A5IIR8_THEP1|nr:NfeD family protein [Thermotoga petrophila]ABQ46091.1 protein of unknown function DUF107 [Thermotoga petrophila RKU-1]